MQMSERPGTELPGTGFPHAEFPNNVPIVEPTPSDRGEGTRAVHGPVLDPPPQRPMGLPTYLTLPTPYVMDFTVLDASSNCRGE